MNLTKKIFLFGAVLFCALTLNSCRRAIGYSVLLWDVPEKNLQDGQIVKVYFKSNISQVYIIGLPGTGENFEVPLWQITTPQSKSKTENTAKKYKEYLHKYAHTKTDGLPVRAEAVNTSKQVYRLHKNEVVRILYKGKGQDVIMADGSKLDGDWLCVLTTGGTQGWCFSHSLSMFTTGPGGKIVWQEAEEVEAESGDEILDQILQAKWYPEDYPQLLADNLIDLESMKNRVAFDPGTESGRISINLDDRNRSAKYNGITKMANSFYSFTGTPFQIIVNSKDEIIVNYTKTGEKPEIYRFVTISSDYDIAELLEKEKERRAAELKRLYNVNEFFSYEYGTLSFTEDNSFSWSDFERLVPALIPEGAGQSGKVSIKYIVDKKLQRQYDGILTFKFAGTSKEVNLFYNLSNNSLVLEDASNATMKNNIATAQGKNSLVLDFTK